MLLTRFLSSVLHGVPTADRDTFIVITMLLATSALLAFAVPARRTARIDPLRTLRED